jgi:cytochrome c oxidase subunit 4
MSITSHDDVPTEVLDGAVKAYSRDRVYVLTAIFLGLVTLVEIATYANPNFPIWKGNLVVPFLMILMAVKFFTIVYIFMHLRFDRPILTRIFYMGLVLAVLVYVAVLSMFRIFYRGQHG